MLHKAERKGQLCLIEEHQIGRYRGLGYKITMARNAPLDTRTTHISIPRGSLAVVKDGDYRMVQPVTIKKWVDDGWVVTNEIDLNNHKSTTPKEPEPEVVIEPTIDADEGDADIMLTNIGILLDNMNHSDDSQWTAIGLPKTHYVQKSLGDTTITRDIINAARPDFKRDEG